MGLGRNLLFEARKVHEAFRDKKEYTFQITGGPEDGSTRECTLRDYYEPKLLQAFVGGEHEQNRPIGLGGIMAGIASVREGNKDKFSPKKNSQLDLFTKATDNGITRWVAWHTFDEAERVSHLRNVQSRLKMLHADDLEALQDYYTALLAEVTKVAKSTKVNS